MNWSRLIFRGEQLSWSKINSERWSKSEKDILITYPLGIQTQCDSNYLLSNVFNKDFVNEIKDRDYDITILKFEIKVDGSGKKFKEKFPTLANEIKK